MKLNDKAFLYGTSSIM